MRRTLAVTVLALWALAGLPGSAHAGGLTSVLITQPSVGQATGLYAGSADYAELDRLLTSGGEAATEAPPQSGGTRYTMTWMAHDVSPWRIDSVHIAGDGTAKVSTDDLVGSEGVAPERAQSTWRAVAEGEELAELLDRLFSGEAVAAEPQQAVDRAPAASPAVPDPPTGVFFSLTGWRWVVPGVLGGLVIGLLASRRRAPAEPRRMLIDKEPEHART